MKYLAKGVAVVALVIGAMVWTTAADAAKIKVAGMTAEILAGTYVVEIIDDEPKSTY